MYHLRPALPTDYPLLSHIGTLANINDEADAYWFPSRHTHPSSYRKIYRWDIDYFARSPFCTIIVVVDSSDIPLGYAAWERCTVSPTIKAKYDHRSKIQKLRDWCWEIFTTPSFWYAAAFPLGAIHQFQAMIWNFRHKEEDPEPDEYWAPNVIAVAPEHQRKGIGAMLLKWGMDRATEDGVPVWLCASPAGMRLYTKMEMVSHGVRQWAPAKTDEERRERSDTYMKWYPPSKETNGKSN